MARLTVVDQYPQPDASGVYLNDVIWVQFSSQIDPETASYYNFSVTERINYEPVDGEVVVQGVSGGIDNAVAVFIPTNYLKRNTAYTMLVSTGISTADGSSYLDHDTVSYFDTGNEAISGNIGSEIYDLDPSGVTEEVVDTVSYDLDPLVVVSTVPADYGTNIDRDIPNIAVTFNTPIPSGIDLYDHIRMTERKVLG